jgi:hypothetical protein
MAFLARCCPQEYSQQMWATEARSVRELCRQPSDGSDADRCRSEDAQGGVELVFVDGHGQTEKVGRQCLPATLA